MGAAAGNENCCSLAATAPGRSLPHPSGGFRQRRSSYLRRGEDRPTPLAGFATNKELAEDPVQLALSHPLTKPKEKGGENPAPCC